MYRRPKFLELLHEIREEMSLEAELDVDIFSQLVRTGKKQGATGKTGEIFGLQTLVYEDISKTEDERPKTQK